MQKRTFKETLKHSKLTKHTKCDISEKQKTCKQNNNNNNSVSNNNIVGQIGIMIKQVNNHVNVTGNQNFLAC